MKKKLKSVLQNSPKTRAYLETLPKIYVVGCWAHYGVVEHYFTGKYDENNVPLVYHYEDHNGETNAFYLMPVTYTTSGGIFSWSTDLIEARTLAYSLETNTANRTYLVRCCKVETPEKEENEVAVYNIDNTTYTVYLDDAGQSFCIKYKDLEWSCGTYQDYIQDLIDIALEERKKSLTDKQLKELGKLMIRYCSYSIVDLENNLLYLDGDCGRMDEEVVKIIKYITQLDPMG